MKKIIGKKYKAIDNSYQINLSKTVDNYYAQAFKEDCIAKDFLAGTQLGTLPTICEIITEPFLMNVNHDDIRTGEYLKEHSFVIVKDEYGYSHITLFNERCVIDE